MKMKIANVAVMLLLLLCYTLWDTVSEGHCSDTYWRIFLTTGNLPTFTADFVFVCIYCILRAKTGQIST